MIVNFPLHLKFDQEDMGFIIQNTKKSFLSLDIFCFYVLKIIVIYVFVYLLLFFIICNNKPLICNNYMTNFIYL